MNLYFDASALVKRHLSEAGTPEVLRAFDEADAVGTAVISRAETEAALAKAVRMRDLREDEARAALGDFRSDWPGFVRVPVTEALCARAGALAFEEGLRGYDAVQLASALTWKEALNEEVVFAAFDVKLWRAAQRRSLVAFPQSLPSLLARWQEE